MYAQIDVWVCCLHSFVFFCVISCFARFHIWSGPIGAQSAIPSDAEVSEATGKLRHRLLD